MPSWPSDRRRDGSPDAQEGSAVVEFVFLAVLLMVPVAYLVLTLGQLQGGAFAVVGAADQAAKVYVRMPSAAAGQAAAEQAVALAVGDLGFRPGDARLAISCDRDCQEPGAIVTAHVSLRVPLPVVAALPGIDLAATTVAADASQKVGRFR
ncbi:hypothetical protein [Specibacter cremeus]|uniref:hypothetical protein n=1 Tax=Specibacter cremeus TaxID=1629051 RepID=UPI0013DDC582|nr:hypothetical protein [Specibacter cremeus]